MTSVKRIAMPGHRERSPILDLAAARRRSCVARAVAGIGTETETVLYVSGAVVEIGIETEKLLHVAGAVEGCCIVGMMEECCT
jgi:Na+(H+)/acetate symporter ActP